MVGLTLLSLAWCHGNAGDLSAAVISCHSNRISLLECKLARGRKSDDEYAVLLLLERLPVEAISLLKRNRLAEHQLCVCLHERHCTEVLPIGDVGVDCLPHNQIVVIVFSTSKDKVQAVSGDPNRIATQLLW